jgi:hypothetical protein
MAMVPPPASVIRLHARAGRPLFTMAPPVTD